MEAVKLDQLDKLSVLFDRYQKKVYNYFLKCTGEPDESHDLAQNTFIRILKYRKSYKSGSTFQIWLFQIARNLVKDYFKKLKVHQDQFRVMETLPEVPEERANLENEQKLYAALAQLSNEKRELLVLAKFQGLKYEEIARIRETSVANIKVQVHRTISELRELYFQTNDDYEQALNG